MSTAVQQSPAMSHISTNGGSNTTVGNKRKRETAPKFYAVRVGNRPGIYHSWAECLDQVKGVKNATFKSFSSLTDAEGFLKHGLSKDTSKFYAVRSGRIPGIYTDWETAKAQIVGWTKPKYKAFTTRTEADAFIREQSTSNGGAVKDEDVQEDDHILNGKSRTPATKKQKRSDVGLLDGDIDENTEPGTGPLPPGAEDGFDPRIILNPETGHINYKTTQQRQATKMQAVGPADGSMIKIYTDGSALGNGRDNAVAGVGVYFGPQDPRNLSEALVGPRQTNQRAELTAIQRAIEIAPRNRDITIYSDSNYAIRCVTEWFVNWRANGWKNSSKEDVKNRDLVEAIVNRLEERDRIGVVTKFHWIKGHADDPGNVAADNLAVTGARDAQMNGLTVGNGA